MELIQMDYEELFELFRKQKNRQTLIKIPKDFYEDCEKMLRFLNDGFETLSDDDLKKQTKIKIANTEKLLKDLIEMRLKRIYNLDIDEWNSVEARLQRLEGNSIK